jgi:FkbM family methyltransferase
MTPLPARLRHHVLSRLFAVFVRPAPRPDTVRLGVGYGSWNVPLHALPSGARGYCVGVGEDTQLDEALLDRGCEVHAFDPTPRAAAHARAVQARRPDYQFTPVGVWDDDTTARFYVPADPRHVSHSIVNLQGTASSFEASVRRVATLLAERGHDHLDLLKLDIEGAEHTVLPDLLASGVRPTVLCVEFDQPVPLRAVLGRVRELRRAGYVPVDVDVWNVTLVRTDSAERGTTVGARPGGSIGRYLDLVDDQHEQLARARPTETLVRRILKRALPPSRRHRARSLATAVIRPWERRKAAALVDRSPLLVHLGSGPAPKPGWVNVDLAGGSVDLAWDLARPLPFPDDSVDGVFSEHVLEHLPLAAGAALVSECHRVLRPGATLRVGVPDAGAMLRSYADDGALIEATRPGRPTPLLAVQEVFYWHGHTTMYDAPTLRLLLEEAGFELVRDRPFGATALPVCPDTAARRAETLYVEGRAP